MRPALFAALGNSPLPHPLSGDTMARSTRRKGRREAEDEDDGDEFEWKPKKKKSKKGTGRTERSTGRSSSTKKKKSKSKSARSKSADGGSTRSKKRSGGTSSSTRKSGSARRKRASGDDDVGNSGRRRRAGPPKKKGVEPIVPISIVTATILICIGLFLFLNKEPPKVVNEQNDWEAAKKIEEEGMAAYREFLAARKLDQPDVTKHKREAAILKLRAAVEAMNAVLDPKRDAEGMLPDEFEGYERDLSQITKYMIDLEKM
jgi:hypothetical protein